jgi:NADPH-dependent 2,4-dienoyl-CoA reductase/sulfur reductase-like enzyme
MQLHHKIVVVGGGSGGLTVAARLCRALKDPDLAIVEPSDRHFYQPLWTLVGGGAASRASTVRAEADLIPRGATWIRDAVREFLPEQNLVTTEQGRQIHYDYLVVAPGLQHRRFANVYALGDASSLPTSRTGAAIRKQAPVLVENLLAQMRGQAASAAYDGYTSCPLVTGYGRLILAEFDYEGQPRETFPFDQSKERRSMYLLKKYALPRLYWHGMLRGLA